MLSTKSLFQLLFIVFPLLSIAQNVPIISYSVSNTGQVELEIDASSDKYYLLHVKHEPTYERETITSMTLGTDGRMNITEPLRAYAEQSYTITEHALDDPLDTDLDGLDDIMEINDMPTLAPLNYAPQVPFRDGTTSINSVETFNELAVVNDNIPWAPFLNDRAFMKFAIVNQSSNKPEIYFINSVTHFIHADFLFTIGVDQFSDDVVTGEIVYNPNEILPSGVIGSYSFNYSFGDAFSYDHTHETYELLAKNMPFLKNNMNHFIGTGGTIAHENNFKNGFVGSRIEVVLESEFFAEVDYIPFNLAEGYGFFKKMELDENPGSRDVVLYDALPNSLPRVGGIITSVVQTPLSHVNLRAIQDNVPNAYIKDPLDKPEIAELIGKYVYYKAGEEGYEIREATLEEVNEWYEKIRPTVPQIPVRDLSQTSILALDDIEFSMSSAFGAKCSNVATMRNFGFPEGTIPDGFGVPFYFYDEFMKHNGFYADAQEMINDPAFISDLETRIDKLKDFRKKIKDADMPQWMLDELQAMHDSFPVGTVVRCRSSTNNEDLPGFSGAGLYTSKTQHLDEGHISKSIKQVYASMWNFRAYDERDFYRVDHFIAAMGVLCHPNFQDEKSNGVGVSIDPIYQTEGNFYLNTQVGESLITNPDANSIPEEMLLSRDPDKGYIVLRNSNLTQNGELVMDDDYLDEMREYLSVIHDEFEKLYQLEGAEGFGMDIEYKVTKDDQLAIKQARPWVSFWADIKANYDLAVSEIVEPYSSASLGDSEMVTVTISNNGLEEMSDFEISLTVNDQLIEKMEVPDLIAPRQAKDFQFSTPVDFSTLGDYEISVHVTHPIDGYERNDTLTKIITKLHILEAELVAATGEVKCDDLYLSGIIANRGATTLNDVKIEVSSDGTVLYNVNYDAPVLRLSEVEFDFILPSNLPNSVSGIDVRLSEVNGGPDAILSNNRQSFLAERDSDFVTITFIVNPDEYPEENLWQLQDINTGQYIDSGLFSSEKFEVDICINKNSCYSLTVADSFGDGICCQFGNGNFEIVNEDGETLIYSNGQFDHLYVEEFCLQNGVLSTEEVSSELIKLYPNPTSGDFIIELDNSLISGERTRLDLFDGFGRLLSTSNLSEQGDGSQFNFSLEEYESGNYYVRCSNTKMEKYLRVIKT